MEIKVINLGKANAAIKVLTGHSDICIISNINDLSDEGKKELYNSKWIVNCSTLPDFKESIKLAKELRPKQVFIMDLSHQIDELSMKDIKSWRGAVLGYGDSLELSDKPNEGIFLDNSQWNIEEGKGTSFQLGKRYRIEGRVFILCIENVAYGTIKLGNISKRGKNYQYGIDKFVPFEKQKLLEIPNGARKGIFVDYVETYYFEDQLKGKSNEELLGMHDMCLKAVLS